MSNRYTVYQGQFVCHSCKATVKSMRHYPESKKITWLCNNNHMTRVSLETRKKKKDYERAERK